MEALIAMGFPNRELNRSALTKANNDISEAVTYLTNPTYTNDDVIIPNESPPPPSIPAFIGPLTKEQVEQQQQQQQHMVRISMKRNVTLMFMHCFLRFHLIIIQVSRQMTYQ